MTDPTSLHELPPRHFDHPLSIWETHGPLELPFFVFFAGIRRVLETWRLVYWRQVFGWKIGNGVRVHWSIKIPRRIDVALCDGVSIGQGTRIIAEFSGGSLEMGENASVSQFCVLDVTGRLRIGAWATISEGAVIYSHSHGRDPRRKPVGYSLSIGEHAWICTRAMVLASARSIGDHAIVGPCTLVRDSVEADAVVLTADNQTLEIS